jgi:hypothetical protein
LPPGFSEGTPDISLARSRQVDATSQSILASHVAQNVNDSGDALSSYTDALCSVNGYAFTEYGLLRAPADVVRQAPAEARTGLCVLPPSEAESSIRRGTCNKQNYMLYVSGAHDNIVQEVYPVGDQCVVQFRTDPVRPMATLQATRSTWLPMSYDRYLGDMVVERTPVYKKYAAKARELDGQIDYETRRLAREESVRQDLENKMRHCIYNELPSERSAADLARRTADTTRTTCRTKVQECMAANAARAAAEAARRAREEEAARKAREEEAARAAARAAAEATVGFQIRGRGRDNYCLSVPFASHASGANMIMWDCDPRKANQRFKRDAKAQLVMAHSGKCLDVYGWQTHNLARVIQWDCHGGANQQWDYDHKGRLHPRNAPSKCLDVMGAGTHNDAAVIIYDCHDGNNQKWVGTR